MRPLLRIMAVLGPVAVLIVELIGDLPLKPRQETGLVVFFLALLAVPLCLFLLMPIALERLYHQSDLLVPLGLLVFAEGVLGWLVEIPAIAAIMLAALPVNILTIG